MKLMKKVLVLALATATILLAACDNGNGGEPSSDSPTLPANKGTDPFDGLETLTYGSVNGRYAVDTAKKTLSKQFTTTGQDWTDEAVYSYSYDGEAQTITVKVDSLVNPESEELVSREQFIDSLKTSFKEVLASSLDKAIAGTETDKQAFIEEAKYDFEITLTEEDLTAEKKEATLEKLWNSPDVQEMVNGYILLFDNTFTYAVALTKKNGTTATVSFEGQYDTNSPWYQQMVGEFSDTNANAHFSSLNSYIRSGDYTYSISSVDAASKTIKGIYEKSNTEKSFSYTTSGSGKDMVVTVDVDGTQIACSWTPAPFLPSPAYN